MTDPEVVRPFRWDVTRREQLGSLPSPDLEIPEWLEGDLLPCCARVVAFAGDSDLLFVGRSPDALFHFLSGAFEGTSWADRLRLLTVSVRFEWLTPAHRRKLVPYLTAVGLDPETLLHRVRPVALVDVVDSGQTLGDICEMVHELTVGTDVEWRALARKLRIVGITWREKPSPNAIRWQQESWWVGMLPTRAIKNVSAPGRFFAFLTTDQPKMHASYRPENWGDPDVARPYRDQEARDAIALALHLYDLGRSRDGREAFGRELVRQPAMRESWFRTLVQEIRR